MAAGPAALSGNRNGPPHPQTLTSATWAPTHARDPGVAGSDGAGTAASCPAGAPAGPSWYDELPPRQYSLPLYRVPQATS